jgi:hypothetical protein
MLVLAALIVSSTDSEREREEGRAPQQAPFYETGKEPQTPSKIFT